MLFANSKTVGTFKGFTEKGLEFAAEIVAPYDSSMLDRPQLGQFLLIELGSPEEAALGRITKFVPTGLLAGPEGEDYVNTVQRRGNKVPEDLKEQRLKYRVQIKLLGAVRVENNAVLYVPSQRRLPHLGAKVALPSPAVLQELCQLSKGTTELGDYVLGEFVFCGSQSKLNDPLFRAIDPKLTVTFNISNLVSKRSVVFARAGYGKSNLMKYLITELYRTTPATTLGLKVGTLIFDPDGEYFWPDKVSNRPGLCDVPHLADKLVVFTNRIPPNPYYGSWKIGEVKLDIRSLSARDVIGIAISQDRQTQQNVLKLKGLSDANWKQLVDLVYQQHLQVSDTDIGRLLGYTTSTQVQNAAGEIAAARSNMYGVVRMLHDPNSRVLTGTIEALRKGAVVVVDISLLSSAAGNMLAGLLLRKIFSHNQENFTGGQNILPVIVVIEEAQSVLGRNLDDTSPYVEWVKEGRKYELGAILITQQPGSMAPELLSQSDNWFCFHLLSEGDAITLGKYNSHYSDDVLAHLIGEPIQGNCFMWSAPKQPFVLPVRIRDFGAIYQKYIKSERGTAATSDTLAQQVMQQVAGAHARLAQKLSKALTQPKVRFIRIPASNGNPELIGVKSGQLYYLIHDAKEGTDIESEESLKVPLMSLLLGHGVFVVTEFDGDEYYSATMDAWEKALGVKPVPR